jgi:peptide/nickel transport system substrate-binding protein
MRYVSLRLLTIFALFALLSVLPACRPENPSSTSPDRLKPGERILGKPGGVLTYRVASPPQTFNYLLVTNEVSLIVAFYLMGGRLVEFDHDSYRYVPGIAEAWQFADDGRTLKVNLREAKFSDGQPLTASDIDFTLRALYDERTASPLFRDVMLINGRPIEVVAIDARHVNLIFPERVASPESYLSNIAVLPRHVLEQDFNRGTLRESFSLTSDPQGIVTSGAFTAYSVVLGERITLRRNPFYWKKDSAGGTLPYLDQIVIEVVSDPNNTLVRLRQGSMDIFDRLRPNDYAALRSETGSIHAIDLGPSLNTDHLWFNLNLTGRENLHKQVWFNDVRFRRAVSHAIDREAIAKFTLQGLATPLYNFVSPSNRSWVADKLERTEYDLAKARALLKEGRFVFRGPPDRPELYDDRGFPVEITMIVPAESQVRGQLASVVQENWAKLGIKLTVAPVAFAEMGRRIEQSFDYDAVLLGAQVSEPDPSSYNNILLSSSKSNPWHPKQLKPATAWEARIDQLVGQQASEPNTERRRALFKEIQLIMARELPLIPIVARHSLTGANKRIGNQRPSTLMPYSLWNAEELFVRQ